MKRNINLQDLSKDHHHGLLLGWKIRQGLKYQASASVIKEYIQYFYKEALAPHFKEEEELLFSHLPDDNEFKQKALEQHSELEKLVDEINKNAEERKFLLLADLLEQHIRFEERSFFPYLESSLTADSLEIIGNELKNQHQPFTDNFPHEFWKFTN